MRGTPRRSVRLLGNGRADVYKGGTWLRNVSRAEALREADRLVDGGDTQERYGSR